MISQEANRVLAVVAEEAASRWPEYASYCRTRESGVRSAAFQHLAGFMAGLKRAGAGERREFVDWICRRFLEHELSSASLLPQPLLQQVVMPVLEEWRDHSAGESAPFRWLGVLMTAPGYAGMRAGLYVPPAEGQEMLRRALEVDGGDQIALVRFVECRIAAVAFGAHHLPDGYIGDPAEHLQWIEDSLPFCLRVEDEAKRARLLAELGAARQEIEDWRAALSEGADFRQWCREHGRQYQWTITHGYRR